MDEFEYLIVCIDYFSKWSEAKPIHDKSALTVAQFLSELIYRHGCFAIQINDQGREFANEVADGLHSMTGTQQRDIRILPTKQWFTRASKPHN